MIAQIGIVLFGLTAIWLSQDARPLVARWACVAGLLSQPFWFMSAWHAEQWGIFAISFAYTVAWLRGFRTHWFPHFADSAALRAIDCDDRAELFLDEVRTCVEQGRSARSSINRMVHARNDAEFWRSVANFWRQML